MKILYKLATRSRPEKMFASIENIRGMALERDPWIIVTLDYNDPTLSTEVIARLNSYKNVEHVIGASRNKIHAFNRDIPADGWNMVVASSDDIRYRHGFDEQIRKDAAAARLQFDQPSSIDFTIWYGDGFPHDKIMTVPIMTKKYYDRLGYIYNPIYTNLFCDEEAIYVGNNLGLIYYSEAEIMEHMHPAWGKAEWDAQYRFTDSHYPIDRSTFLKRKALNFPI